MINRLITLSFLLSFLYLSSDVYSNPPESVEDLLYTTVRIQCTTKKGDNVGTGFIYDFKEKHGVISPYLVTNKHVIQDAERGEIKFNISQDNRNPNELYPIQFGGDNDPFSKMFIDHSSQDLCAFPLARAINFIENNLNTDAFTQYQKAISQYQKDYQQAYIKNQFNGYAPYLPYPSQPVTKKVFYRSLNEDHLINVSYRSPIQDILMVGYPIGISDNVNNLPIVRKGITASHVNKNFQGRNEVLIDAACFPGSSGSPVFLSEGIKGTHYADTYFKPTLLGILYSGPRNGVNGELVYDTNGHMLPEPIPTAIRTYVPPHLGFVIKGDALKDIQQQILQ